MKALCYVEWYFNNFAGIVFYTYYKQNCAFFNDLYTPDLNLKIQKKNLSVWINTVYQPMHFQWQLVCGAIFLVPVAELLVSKVWPSC